MCKMFSNFTYSTEKNCAAILQCLRVSLCDDRNVRGDWPIIRGGLGRLAA